MAEDKHAGGRPTHCTREICQRFEELLASTNYFMTVCAYLDIDESVAYDWINKGVAGQDAAGDWPDAYREFAKSVKRGSARGEIGAVAEINLQGREHNTPAEGRSPGQWQAMMTLLERRFPDRWSRNERREVSGPGGGPMQHEVSWWDAVEAWEGDEDAEGDPDSEADDAGN